MKVLIWIGCFIIHYILNNLVTRVFNYITVTSDAEIILFATFKGLLVAASFGFSWWLALKLCKKWDWHQAEKKASEAGMTVSEYGKQGLSEEFLAKLEEMSKTVPYEQVKSQLKACVKKRKINKEQYTILLNEYCEK